MSLNIELLEVLVKSSCSPEHYRSFVGETVDSLVSLPLRELESKLATLLSSDPNKESLIIAIISKLIRPSIPIPIPNQEPTLCPHPPQRKEKAEVKLKLKEETIKQEIKEETKPSIKGPDEERGVGSGSVSGDEDEVEIVDQVFRDVSIIRVLDPSTIPRENITLEEEEEYDSDPHTHPTDSGSAGVSCSENALLSPGPSNQNPRKRKSGSAAQTPAMSKKSRELRNLTPWAWDKVQNSNFALGGHSEEDFEWRESEWMDLFFFDQSPKIRSLAIISNGFHLFPNTICLLLPNLRQLVIQSLHAQDINYPSRIVDIVKGAANGRRKTRMEQEKGIIEKGPISGLDIELFYDDEMSLRTFLQTLSSIDGDDLTFLESLSIHRRKKDPIPLLLSPDLRTLSSIRADNLAHLDLAICLPQNGKKEFERMLQSFSKLKTLRVHGCFITCSNSAPKVFINFPKMEHLEVLDMGGSYRFKSSFETLTKTPDRKSKRVDPSRTNVSSGAHAVIQNDQKEGKNLKIYVKFPGVMKSLQTVIFGSLYKIQDLYFADLPQLSVFRVASSWNLQCPTCFRSLALRRSSAQNGNNIHEVSSLKELQFPDSFQDYNILPQILQHFPNLRKCYLNLPTVKLLRAFAKSIVDSPVLQQSLKHIVIKTQFDFSSSLDAAILDDINLATPLPLEKKQVRILKKYKYWKEYVQHNQIELPFFAEEVHLEENGDEEEKNKFCGLEKLLPSLELLVIEHIPRILRLPMGTRHWIEDEHCEYSQMLIGFKKFPISQETRKTLTKTNCRVMVSDVAQTKGDYVKSCVHD